MKIKKLPKRAYSRKHYVFTLIMYTFLMTVCFIMLMDGGGIFALFFLIGSVFGVGREASMRRKAKNEMAAIPA